MSTERHEYVNTSPQSPPVPPRRRRRSREHLPSAVPAITAHHLHEATPCPGCAGPSLLRGEPGRLRDTHPAPPDPQLRRPKKRGRGWDGPLTQGHGGRRWKRCFAQRRQRLSDEAAAPGMETTTSPSGLSFVHLEVNGPDSATPPLVGRPGAVATAADTRHRDRGHGTRSPRRSPGAGAGPRHHAETRVPPFTGLRAHGGMSACEASRAGRKHSHRGVTELTARPRQGAGAGGLVSDRTRTPKRPSSRLGVTGTLSGDERKCFRSAPETGTRKLCRVRLPKHKVTRSLTKVVLVNVNITCRFDPANLQLETYPGEIHAHANEPTFMYRNVN